MSSHPARRRWTLALVLALSCATGGCERCGDDGRVAELVSTTGEVRRDFAASVDRWEGADRGARFAIGDGVRTEERGAAELTLRGGARLRLEESTTVRFLRHPGSGAGLEVTTGAAVLEASDEALSLTTRFGDARLEPRARMRLSAEEGGMQITVLFGRAVFDERTLEEGGELRVRFGDAVVDEPAPPEPVTHVRLAERPELEGALARAPTFVVRRSGAGATLRAEGASASQPIGDEELEVGAGARILVPARAEGVLRRGGAESVLEGRGEYVVASEDTGLVRAISGSLDVVRAERDVIVEVPGGTIVVRGGEGARTQIEVRGRRGTQIRVHRGSSAVNGARDTDTLLAGETAVLTPEGELTVGGRGPSRADLTIAAGATVTVHDPRPPTALGVRFAELCRGRGVLELMRGTSVGASSAGEGQANVLLSAGAHVYRVRCPGNDAAAASGSVRVLRDNGVEPLPPSAARTVVDTDGRTYRVLYQTHLPDITVRWPRAPSTGPYVLTLRPASGAPRTFSSASPRVDLTSGTVSTGTYQLSFSAGAESARQTTLEIRFDNAMPTASIRAPVDGSFAAGESVRVAGIAVPGWSAAIEGVALELDRELRFEGTVMAPSHHGALAIELRHPSRGRHFYLRRPRQAAP